MSFHLLEDYIFTSLATAVSAAGSTTVTVGSLGTPRNALYDGAQLIIDWGNPNQEVVTVTAVNASASTFTATFSFTHAIGAQVIGATFPVQASSGDYFFSQSEIQSYLARAQHEYLAQVPCIFQLNTQTVQFGQIYQQLVCDAIEMHRVASSRQYIALSSLTRGGGGGFGEGGFGEGPFGVGAGTPNLVTAVSLSPHNLIQGQKFSIYGAPDPSFDGAFIVGTVINSTSWSYNQAGPNATTNGGAAVLWLRLLETSGEELSIQNPFWRNQNITQLRAWGEDRSGNYTWFVDGKPASQFPVEVLVSQRDTDTLAMTDFFLVPDMLLHYVKYKALEYCWSKDGEARDPLRAKYATTRFDRGIMATKRWLDGMGVDTGMQRQKATVR
jgi:hypothetical protein